MGLFFKAASGTLEREFEDAVRQEPPADDQVAPEAARHAANAKAASGSLSPNLGAFVGAAVVFVFLVGASYFVGVEADKIPVEQASQVRDLGAILQGLITAWSGAAIGLIAGEAVGKTSA